MFLEDEYPDTIISLRNVPLLNFSFNNLAHISPKTNLTRETLNLITVPGGIRKICYHGQPPSKLLDSP